MVLLNISSDTFFFYKNILRIYGIWPLDGRTPRSVLIYLMFLLLEIAITILYLMDVFTKCNGYINGQYEIMTAAGVTALVVLRLIFRLYGNRIIPLIESTIDDWSLITDPTERTIMKRHDKFGTFFFLITIMYVCTFPCVRDYLLLAFTNILTKNHRLTSTGNDCLAWDLAIPVLHIGAKIVLSFSYYCVFILIWSLIVHHCGQYQILKQQFKKFLQMGNEKERRREFRRLVDRHNELIVLSSQIEDSFNVFVAVDLLALLILVCITASHLGYAIKDSDFVKLTEMIASIVYLVVTAFLYYSAADYLTTSSEGIGDVLRQCNWYDLPKEWIINFSIIIARSRKPSNLTAAKMYKLNRSTYRWILNAIYSYVSMIVPITKN